jgi:serine O-acetyltransferase
MTAAELRHLVAADLYRYDRETGWNGLVRAFLREPGFRFTCLLRLCRHLRAQPWSRWGTYHICKFWLGRLSLKLGVYIDITTEIGPGLYLPHPIGIVINRRCRIGANCNIAQHVTLGLKSRDPRAGCPSLGDRVYVGPGAVIIGALRIGNDAAVGANAVVTQDVPDQGVAAGVPATLRSLRGSAGYINNCLPTSAAASHP